MEQKKNIMDYDTVSLDDESSAVVIIDQTKLPGTTEIIALKTAQEIWDAIYLLQVRGAPAIGVAAAYGIYVLAKGIDTDNYDEFYAEFKKQKEYLDSSRPTAVNLSWALNRMEQVVLNNADKSVSEIKQLLKEQGVRRHVRKNDRISYDVYSLELVIAVAFRIDSIESRAFREFIMQAIIKKQTNRPKLVCLWSKNIMV